MIFVPGGTFHMGSDRHYPEEAPVHRVTVDGFWMDRKPVTNREFLKFVNATAYVTFAEQRPDPKDYPGALPHMLKAGSLVFAPPKRPVDLRGWSQWFTFKFGANWRRPCGPRSSISALDDHPVVQVAYRDAEAYAKWAGKDLPRAAGSTAPSSLGATSSCRADAGWRTPGRARSRTKISADGYGRTSPVTTFPPNGYGLYDMIGNVWEWTSDWYSQKHEAEPSWSRWRNRLYDARGARSLRHLLSNTTGLNLPGIGHHRS
jgi:sulfatase modifying factor 1